MITSTSASAPTTFSRTKRTLISGLAAAALTIAGVIGLGATPAQAISTYDALYGMGATVGGSSGPSYYSPANFYPQTTCTGKTNQVRTVVVASPRNGTGGQWFGSKVWARDITGRVGAWSYYGWSQTWIAETNSMSYSMADYRNLTTSSFTGYDGHHYEIVVEVYVANGSSWQSLGQKRSNHYTTFGATETNFYGQTLQSIPGLSAGYCTVL